MVSNLHVYLTWLILSWTTRWRPLEAALAALGSVAEAITDLCEERQEEGQPQPIDIKPMLANVIPSLLLLSGVFLQLWTSCDRH